MKIKCVKTTFVSSRRVRATCKTTGYATYGPSNRLARAALKWLLYSKMADRPFEDEEIKQILGVKWFNKL